MLVIADSSPIIVLTTIGHVGVLPVLFGTVTIPPQVAEELTRRNRPQVQKYRLSRMHDRTVYRYDGGE